ncbi:MAG: hypothetical protein RBR77_07065 [Thauera sp.]|jgi:hypothetical protein|nr:hypothetical protein [Thauera sp.]
MSDFNDVVGDAVDATTLAADVLRDVAALLDGADSVLELLRSPIYTVPNSAKRLFDLAFERCDQWASHFEGESKRFGARRVMKEGAQ